jgi:Ni/Fe-hydrogenase 1 B-type cytochrome subunit
MSPTASKDIIRVYVWEFPVRLAHWALVVAIIVLSFTGVYIHNPFIVARGDSAWVTGTVRYIHILSGFVFSAAFLLRLYWFFVGNQWARIGQFIPLSKERRGGMRGMLQYYGFLKWNPVSEIGHNALAGSAYCAIFGLIALEILSGMALLYQTSSSPFLGFLIGWLPRLIDIQYLRAMHYFIMFAFGTFFIHHIYSAILISWEEKSGLMESIFTGYKFISRGMLERKGVAVPKEVTRP